jgi:CheY-specific phosphatase CheX
MDRTLIESSLLAAAEDVLDSMCFTALEGQMPVAALQWPGELLVELSVGRHLEFDGVCCGHFGLRMEAATARMIAGNLLGEDEEFLTEAQSSEAVGEIANMICGSLLGRLEAKHAFRLSSPVIWPKDAAEPPRSEGLCIEGRATVTDPLLSLFTLDCGRMLVWMQVA